MRPRATLSGNEIRELTFRGACVAACLGGLTVYVTACARDTSAAARDFSAPFVDAARIVPGLVTEMRYATSHNFTGAPVEGYGAPLCWLTRKAAGALARVQSDLRPYGYVVKVFDCYRPVRAVRSFVEWAKAEDERGKREFFPNVAKRDLFRLGYISDRSSHSRGSTVDLTLIDRKSGNELDMGTPFDLFDRRSHPDAPGQAAEARRNRRVLRGAMQRRGFIPYDQEWWHFTLRNEPFPHKVFDLPIR